MSRMPLPKAEQQLIPVPDTSDLRKLLAACADIPEAAAPAERKRLQFEALRDSAAAAHGRMRAAPGVDQDVGSARGSRYAERDPHGRQQRNCAIWSGMTMPSGNHGQESQMTGTASLASAIAVGCMVAGCGGESTDWYTAGKA